MGRKVKKLFEKVIERGFRDSNGELVSNNGIKVVVFSNESFMIYVRDYVEGYLEDTASYVGNLNEAVELNNSLDKVIEILRKE